MNLIMVAIVGPSGSGKTTLMSMITGMLGITEGEIIFNNKKMTSMTKKNWENYEPTKLVLFFNLVNLFLI